MKRTLLSGSQDARHDLPIDWDILRLYGHLRHGAHNGIAIWILATPMSSVGPSISSVTFDIKDFDIE